jgi:hypothetical protein
MAVIRPNAEPPITAVASGDIFLIDGATGVRALAATSVALRDANGNVALNNVVEGFTSTATAGGTTTLTVASASQQFFTGMLAQTVVLPVTSTLQVGQGYFFQNSSTAAVTVESSGGNTVKVIGPGAFAIVTCISLTGTTAASWQASYFGDIVVSGRVLTVSNSLTLAGTDGTAMTFPSTSATIARTDAGQTFTGTQAFGALTATSLNGNVWTAGTGTLTLAAGKTLTASNTLNLAGTDGTTQTFPTTSATLARTDAGQTFTGTQVFGALTATTINGNTVTAGTGVLTIAAAKTLTVSNSLTLAGTDGTTQTFPTTSGTVVTSASVNVVTNAMRAQMAAWTLKGNATAAPANEADIDVTALTAKASPVSADIVLIQDSAASNAFKKTTVGAIAASGVSGVSSLNGQTGALANFHMPQGRLTLTSATPVLSATASGQTTVYYTPYLGNMLPIYDGSNMVMTATAEVSQATADTTKSPAAVAASSLYDIFVWNDSGTIRATRGPAWTNSTTRSAGTALVRVNGVLLNNASITNGPAASRGTYVGTIASNASSTIDFIFGSSVAGGGAAFFGVWNMYNRKPISTFVNDSNGSWTLATINTRTAFDVEGAGSGLNNRISYVTGLSEDGVSAKFRTLMTNPAGGSAAVGIGFNTAAAPSGSFGFGVSTASTNAVGSANYDGPAGTGFNFLQALQFTQTASATFYGILVGGTDQSALSATFWN